MHSKKEEFKLFSRVFKVRPESDNEDLLIELNELQSNEFYESKLGDTGTSVIKFYNILSKSFPNSIDHAKKLLFVCLEVHIYMNCYFRK